MYGNDYFTETDMLLCKLEHSYHGTIYKHFIPIKIDSMPLYFELTAIMYTAYGIVHSF